MKIGRIILIVCGILYMVMNSCSVFLSVIDVIKEGRHDGAYISGMILGSFLSYIPGFLCFYFATRIRKKIKLKEAHLLVQSLPD